VAGSLGRLIAAVTDARPRAESPIPYVSASNTSGVSFFADPGVANAEAQLAAMGASGTIYSIVRALATGVSKWEWWLERDRNQRGRNPGAPAPVVTHPALDLWERPNPFMRRVIFTQIVQQHLELAGEGYLGVSRAGETTVGPPLELWPIRPDRMEPVGHPTKFLTGWVYTSPDGEKIPLELTEVIQLRFPHPTDPYRGMSPLESVMDDVQAARYAALWNKNFFINSAEPGGLIEVDHILGDEEYRELRDRWREQHRGVAAAHRVGILENGAKWVERKFSMKDMQFEALRGVNDEQARTAWGVSKTMLGAMESETNRATAEAAEYVFGAWRIDPRLDLWNDALTTLLEMFGTKAGGLRWCHEDPSPENAEAANAERDSKVEAAVALIGAGFNPTEVLEQFGLPPLTYGLPGADPDRDLLTKLVIGAPTLAPMILPMLGFELPEGFGGTAPVAPAEDPAAAPTPLELAASWARQNGNGHRPALTG
jgi:HK97 family phage portal protein